jgi:hypothetical protein
MAILRPHGSVIAGLNAASLVLCLSLVACDSGPNTPSQLLDALRGEQHTNHIVIGYKDGDSLDYIDAFAGNTFKSVLHSIQPKNIRSIEMRGTSEVLAASDGKWIASCTDKMTCEIREKGNPGRKFSVSRKDALTAFYWSPDDRLVLVIEKAPNWRFPPRCSLEDERDVTVYDTATGTSGVLTTVCGGFPYGSLRWYELNAP